MFLGKNGGSPLSRKGSFFWGTGTLLAEDTAINNRERLNPGDPSGEVPSIRFQQTLLGFFDGLCMHLNWFTSFGQGSVLLLKPKLLVPPADAPLVLFKDLFQCFPRPCRQTCRPKLSSKTVQMAKWYIMISDRFFWFKSILTVPKNTRDSDPESRNISGKRKCQGDINRHVWATKCFDLRRVLQIDSQPIPYVTRSSQPLKLTLPNLLVRTSPPFWKI